jgi:hypothetical protein
LAPEKNEPKLESDHVRLLVECALEACRNDNRQPISSSWRTVYHATSPFIRWSGLWVLWLVHLWLETQLWLCL